LLFKTSLTSLADASGEFGSVAAVVTEAAPRQAVSSVARRMFLNDEDDPAELMVVAKVLVKVDARHKLSRQDAKKILPILLRLPARATDGRDRVEPLGRRPFFMIDGLEFFHSWWNDRRRSVFIIVLILTFGLIA